MIILEANIFQVATVASERTMNPVKEIQIKSVSALLQLCAQDEAPAEQLSSELLEQGRHLLKDSPFMPN